MSILWYRNFISCTTHCLIVKVGERGGYISVFFFGGGGAANRCILLDLPYKCLTAKHLVYELWEISLQLGTGK